MFLKAPKVVLGKLTKINIQIFLDKQIYPLYTLGVKNSCIGKMAERPRLLRVAGCQLDAIACTKAAEGMYFVFLLFAARLIAGCGMNRDLLQGKNEKIIKEKQPC